MTAPAAKRDQLTAAQARIAQLELELGEAREQQAATSEVLQTISHSAFDLEAVLRTLVESAAKLCDAPMVNIHLAIDGYFTGLPVSFGFSEEQRANYSAFKARVGDRGSFSGRVSSEMSAVHIPNIEHELGGMLPRVTELFGIRTALGVPLLSKGTVIGVFSLFRLEADPFTEKQIELVTTFADQAVIAIENVRLFQEVEQRTNDLQEALEQQTAMSDILGIISRSATDMQPVLDTILEHTARLCDAPDTRVVLLDGDQLVAAAVRGRFDDPIPSERRHRLGEEVTVADQAILERRTIRVDDWLDPATAAEFPDSVRRNYSPRAAGARAGLCVPLLREGGAAGVLIASRQEPKPFTDQHVRLIETFADQAVIAIENVRLFRELQDRNKDLQEALEQQTATAEVLQTISHSAFDLDSVLQTLTESGAKLADAESSSINRIEGGHWWSAARYGMSPEQSKYLARRGGVTLDESSLSGRVFSRRAAIHIPDMLADPELGATSKRDARRFGNRTVLGVPLLREGEVIGVFSLRRVGIRPFADRHIDVLQTFADQAVIAIENARLVQELRESLEQQTAISDILGVISRSPTDIQPVLDTIVQHAARLSEVEDVRVLLREGDQVWSAAEVGGWHLPIDKPGGLGFKRSLGLRTPVHRAMLEGRTIRVDDFHDPAVAAQFPDALPLLGTFPTRSGLYVPLLRDGASVGEIFASSEA
ncbi:MAG TPA: GAF domain-containing protein, partial [Chloroflexota bacterium]